MPMRIQRKRSKGWRMPAGAVYVGRPTRWGNPFVAHDWRASFRAVAIVGRGDKIGRTKAAVELYRFWLAGEKREVKKDHRDFWQREIMTVQCGANPTITEIREALRGKDLACWCALDQPCHADVLLRIANE